MNDVEIRRGYFPGSIGLVLELHARYYHAHWGFGVLFEAQLASGLAAAMMNFAMDSGLLPSRGELRAPLLLTVCTPLTPVHIFDGS